MSKSQEIVDGLMALVYHHNKVTSELAELRMQIFDLVETLGYENTVFDGEHSVKEILRKARER